MEVIKVERKSDDESDIMSEVSEGMGWIGKEDDRHKKRAMQNKTLWKIINNERGEKKEEE